MCITKGVPALQIMCIVYCICKMTNVNTILKVAISRARVVGHDRDRNDRARVVCMRGTGRCLGTECVMD